jgi:hypothetical protein
MATVFTFGEAAASPVHLLPLAREPFLADRGARAPHAAAHALAAERIGLAPA